MQNVTVICIPKWFSPDKPTPLCLCADGMAQSILCTYHMIDTGERRIVRNCFERGSGSISICGGGHFPAELNGGLVDPSLTAALLHHQVLGEARIARGNTDQGVTRRWRLLSSCFGVFFNMVVFRERHHLRGQHMKARAL